jgi:hypothetical protein
MALLLIGADRESRTADALHKAQSRFAAAVKLRNDDVAARREFKLAAADFGEVMQNYGETSEVRRVQGNALILCGRIPEAIYALRSGYEIDPDNAKLLRSLEYARSRLNYASLEEREALMPQRESFAGARRVVHRWGALLVAVLGIVGWGLMGRWIATRKPKLLAISLGTLIFAALIATVWFVDEWRRDSDNSYPCAVLNRPEVLRSGDGFSFPPVRESPLPAGVEVRVLQSASWTRVELANGSLGWLPNDCIWQFRNAREATDSR